MPGFSINNISYKKLPLIGGFIRAFSIDYRSLALFRVCIGMIIFVDLVLRSRDFKAFFTEQGIIPRRLALNWWPDDATYSLYFINGSTFFNAVLVTIALLLALSLIVGYKTQRVTVLSWILLVSLHQRTGILSHGGDDLLRLLLFWGMFLPLGARFSIDAALEQGKPFPNETLFSVGTFCLLMQAMAVYWVGALLKTGRAWQIEHTAIYYTLNAEQFTTEFGRWVLIHFDFLLPILSKFVLLIELYGPLFILSPFFLLYLRLPILVLLICMHVGFALLLNVGFFPFISITSLLLFIPKEFWRFLHNYWVDRRSENVIVYVDPASDFSLKGVMILKVMLILPQLKVRYARIGPKSDTLVKNNNSWIIEKPDGKCILNEAALVWLFSRSCLFFWMKRPFQILAKINWSRNWFYKVSEHWIDFKIISATLLPWRTRKGKISWLNHILAILFFVLFLQINLKPVITTSYVTELPGILRHVKFSLGLWQKWNMFAPYPITVTRWPVFEGVTYDGRKVDIFRQKLGTPNRGKPENILSEYTNHRWRKFYNRLYLKKFKYYRSSYVNFECRRWNNKARIQKDYIKKINLFMVNERTLIDSSKEVTKLKSMGSYMCRK